jgi:hypothetical protein
MQFGIDLQAAWLFMPLIGIAGAVQDLAAADFPLPG